MTNLTLTIKPNIDKICSKGNAPIANKKLNINEFNSFFIYIYDFLQKSPKAARDHKT